MKKKAEKRGQGDELRRGYDLRQLKGGVRGKYAARYRVGTNLVLRMSRRISLTNNQ